MVAICDFIFFYGYVKDIEYLLVIKKKKKKCIQDQV